MAHGAGRGWREEHDRAHTAAASHELAPAARSIGELARALKDRIERHRLGIVAAGVAFYAMVAVFPMLAAGIGIYGLLADPSRITQHLASLTGILPQQALDVLEQQLDSLTGSGSGRATLGVGLAVGIVLALWSASAGVKALMKALNVAYEVREQRGFVRRALVGLALTLGAIVVVALALGLVVVLPAAVQFVGLGAALGALIAYARWPILALAAIFAIGVLYRYGPSREPPRWTWWNRGAVTATALWLAGSALFSWYVSNFGRYNETYGAVAAIVIMLLWFLLSAYAILIGAEINAARQQPTLKQPT